MPTRPPVFDTIRTECDRAVVAQVVRIKCCVTKCSETPSHVVSLAMTDGKRNVYALCAAHLKALRALDERICDLYEEQGVFFYGGRRI
jgi:hypothetical protein